MTNLTLANVVDSIDADMKRGGSLDSDIRKGVQYAVRSLTRLAPHMTERRHANIVTVAGQTWYATFSDETPADTDQQDDISEIAASFAEPAYGGTVDALLRVEEVFHIDTDGNKSSLTEVSTKEFAYLRATNSSAVEPEYFTRYAKNIGFYPEPSTSGEYVFFMGRFKPFYPTADADTCVFFDDALDYIIAKARWWVATYSTRDTEEADRMQALADDQLAALRIEGAGIAATRRIMGWW